MECLFQKSEILLIRQSLEKKKFSDERTITEQRDITHETKVSQKCLVTSQLLQKLGK